MFVEGSPEYGAPFDPDEQMAPAEGTIDPTVELTDWEPLEGVDDGIDQIGFVDGVRRIDARLLLDDPVSGPTPGSAGRSPSAPRAGIGMSDGQRSRTCEWSVGRWWPADAPTSSPP